MKTYIFILSLILSTFILSSAHAQQDFSNVEIKTIPVRDNVYMLEGQGGNLGVIVGNDRIVLIDDQFAPLSNKILAAVKTIKDVPVKFVINTHWHGDHTGGNAAFGQMATLIAHDNVRKRLTQKQVIEFFGSVIEPQSKEGLPVITFADSLSVHLDDEKIKVIHFPNGHTDGDSVIFFTQSNVVHMGDHMFAGFFPFVDLASGGDVEGYTANVAEILGRIDNDTKVIPGHGPLSSKEDLTKFHLMLVETTDIIRQKIDAGKSLEEIQKEGLPEEWQSWGKGFISTANWIDMVHASLTNK